MQQQKRSNPAALAIYGYWLIAAILSAVVAWQLYSSLVYLFVLLLDNPDLRPLTWNSYTISGIARFLVLIIGIFWLGFISFFEYYFRVSSTSRDLNRRMAGVVAALAVLFGLSYLVFWIF